jgi:hypothetical protein
MKIFKMKQTLALIILLCASRLAVAGGGMWIPSMIDSAIMSKMKTLGSELTADMIFNEDNISLNDGIVWFGKGCTGEVISDQGLILTNYHCGYSQVSSHSSVEKDLLKNGFWSDDFDEELPCPGLSVSFITSIEDVTGIILAGIDEHTGELERAMVISARSDSLVNARTTDNGLKGDVKPYFYGNMFCLILLEEFNDVRLVGAPPSSIGKFGGDTDNWIWPRHTGDFALFRIYADSLNEPSGYHPSNRPYKPKFSFPISLKGYEKDDFTLVYGFPAVTNQYITASEVIMRERLSNPARISVRRSKLDIIDKAMSENDTIRIMYAPKQQRIANAYKKWQGEILGTEANRTIERKKEEEKLFTEWALDNNYITYQTVVNEIDSVIDDLSPYKLAQDYVREALWGPEILGLVKSYMELEALVLDKKTPQVKVKAEKGKFINTIDGHFRSVRPEIDQALFRSLYELAVLQMNMELRPEALNDMFDSEDVRAKADTYYNTSLFTNKEKLKSAIARLDYKRAKQIQADPLHRLVSSVKQFEDQILNPGINSLESSLKIKMRSYMSGLMEYHHNKTLHPDANRTLRVSFGKIEGFEPRDGLVYKHYTTLEGVLEKEDPESDEFYVDPRLSELFRAKDYGDYASNDTLYVGFIASNHTSGGNSGSPVINSEGHLIGTNFDRVWEGTMSDIEFDDDRCRNISLDIRYTLFVIDKFAGCHRLIEEMDIIK